MLTEYDVAGVTLDDIKLTGKIDKIEIFKGGAVNVVDYKTGKPKSRKTIEGLTASSEGNMKRQLVFYKLLLDRAEKGKYRMVSGEIDFVEPDEDTGVYKKESFLVTSEEEMELTEQIRKMAREVRSGEFLDHICADPVCEFCALRLNMAS